ncbi:MAG: DUF1476 domain-containing protein [Pseudomonadota bacterium]
MSAFDEREQAFEKKFAHDAEMQFKAAARGNKLLGLWLAGELGIEDAETYAKTVVVADLAEEGHEDVIRKVMTDISDKGASVTEAQVRAKLAECMIEAKAQVLSEVS